MVLCVVIGCYKCLDQDKDVSFHRITAVVRHTDKRDFELSKKRREGYLLLFPEQISILMGSIIGSVQGTLIQASLITIILIQTGYLH